MDRSDTLSTECKPAALTNQIAVMRHVQFPQLVAGSRDVMADVAVATKLNRSFIAPWYATAASRGSENGTLECVDNTQQNIHRMHTFTILVNVQVDFLY